MYLEDRLAALEEKFQDLQAQIDDLTLKPAGYTTHEFASIVRVLEPTVSKWCRNYVLRATKDPSGKWRIPRHELERYQREGLRKKRRVRFGEVVSLE